MESRQQPTPHSPTPTKRLAGPPPAESNRDVLVRVLIVNEGDEEEEKEAGYGHGV